MYKNTYVDFVRECYKKGGNNKNTYVDFVRECYMNKIIIIKMKA